MPQKITSDGRRQRSERSRQAMIDAAIEMVEEGILAPTAQEISDRAGVGIRTLFRQFEGMDGLYTAIDQQTRPIMEAKFTSGNREGSPKERLLHAVEQHAKAYEEMTNLILLTLNQRWRSPVLRKNYDRANRQLRIDLDEWLPELKNLSTSHRETVDAIASFDMWHRLREHQHLSERAAIDIIYNMLKGFIIAS